MIERLIYFLLGVLVGALLRQSAPNGEMESSSARQMAESTPRDVPVTRAPLALETSPDRDSLVTINGIGPAYEKLLNDMGIFTFAQLAQQNADDLAGRLPRLAANRAADWIAQARAKSEEAGLV